MSDIFDDIDEPKDIFDEVAGQEKKTTSTMPLVQNLSAPGAVMPSGVSGDSLIRFGKRIANIPVELAKGVVTTAVGVPHDLYKQLTTAHAVAADAQTSFFSESKFGRDTAEKLGLPEFDIAEPKNREEKIADLAAGVASFAGELAVLKGEAATRLGPAAKKIPEYAYWVYQAMLNGQNPAVAAAQGKLFGHLDKLPSRDVLEKSVKMLSEAGVLYGTTRMAGGSQEEALMAAAVPAAMRVPGAVRAVTRPSAPAPKPDIVRKGEATFKQRLAEMPPLEEPPVIATAEGTISGPAAEAGPNPVQAEYDARIKGEWEQELHEENRAYERLQTAIGTRDKTRIRRAQAAYDKAKPLSREFLRQMADQGDPDAQARLGRGYFMPDDVDSASPLTDQERSAAKRMGLGKELTGYRGTMTPGQVRLALRGEQGSTLGVPEAGKPEVKPEPPIEPAEAPAKPAEKPEGTVGHPVEQQKKEKSEFDQDVELADKRLNDLAKSSRSNIKGEKRLNVWASARNVLRQFDAITGTDTASWVEKVDRRANIEAVDEATQKEMAIMQRHGLTDESVKLPTGESSNRIGQALFNGDPAGLTADELRFFNAAKDMLDLGGEYAARRKWQMWKNGTEVPGGIEGDAKMRKTIKDEGMKAEAEGRLDEWLKTQPWAKREAYFMSDQHPADQDGDSLFREGSPTITGREAKTRETAGKAKKVDNLFAEIHDHILRLARSEAANDEIPQIWRRIKAAGLDPRSEAGMKDLLKNVAGIHRPSYGAEALAIAGKMWFWRLKFLNPRFVYRFTVQNFTQLLYMKTHMSTMALTKGTEIVARQKYAGTRDVYRVKEAERLWGKASRQNQLFVTQLRDAGNEFKNNHPEVWKLTSPLVNFVDSFVHASSSADPMVREMSWHVYDAAAKDYLTRFQRGEITWKQVENNIQLKTIHPGQAKDIYYRIQKGEIDRAASMIAEVKTSDTHARYELTQRSLAEQTKAGRLYLGPMTYIRSLYEMAWHQGIKPIQAGLKHDDLNLVWRGTKNLMFLGVGYYLAAKAFEKATGRFSPLASGAIVGRSPGLDFIVGPLDDVSQVSYQAETQQWSTTHTAEATAERLAGRLEQTMPLADLMTDYYESTHNVEGVRFWTLIKSKLNHKWYMKYKKQWKPADRTALEGWMHVLVGGFEQGQEKRERQARQQEAKGL